MLNKVGVSYIIISSREDVHIGSDKAITKLFLWQITLGKLHLIDDIICQFLIW